MGKKWEAVTFGEIRVGDMIRCSDTFEDGTVRTMAGVICFKELESASTKDGVVLARAAERGVMFQRRVQKVKLPVEPGTVIDAVVDRAWNLNRGVQRREIRLIRGRERWVGMERGTGWQFIADDENIKSWTLVAAP
jgi:hypothetical protein